MVELETLLEQPAWNDAAAFQDQLGFRPQERGTNPEHPAAGR
jgi:hypothetical protein